MRGTRAIVESRGRRREVDASYVTPSVGDFVLLQVGVIVQILDREEALETLRAWEEVEASGGA